MEVSIGTRVREPRICEASVPIMISGEVLAEQRPWVSSTRAVAAVVSGGMAAAALVRRGWRCASRAHFGLTSIVP
eukprot:1460909-Pleurochrysis_carterae.AAC.1